MRTYLPPRKRIAKEAEQQEDFLFELRDFEDKLYPTAILHFEPDLNDGVSLNIAPLHELVPWNQGSFSQLPNDCNLMEQATRNRLRNVVTQCCITAR